MGSMGKKKARIAELEAQVKLQQETLSYLWLYLGRFEVSKLTTEQKDCLADAVDACREEDDLYRVERWWRD